MPLAASNLLRLALVHMEAAIDLLDQCAAPVGTVEYLDLAINNLSVVADPSGETQMRQLARTQRLGEIIAE